MAIENIFGRCVKVRGPGGPEDHMGYLDAIKQRLTDLQSIVGSRVRSAEPDRTDGSGMAPAEDSGRPSKQDAVKATASASGSAAPTNGEKGSMRASRLGGDSTSQSIGASTTSINGARAPPS